MAMRSRAGFTHPGHSCRHEFSSVGTAYLYIRSNIPMSMWTQVHFIQKSTLNVDAGVLFPLYQFELRNVRSTVAGYIPIGDQHDLLISRWIHRVNFELC
jgi:hypothetical protein